MAQNNPCHGNDPVGIKSKNEWDTITVSTKVTALALFHSDNQFAPMHSYLLSLQFPWCSNRVKSRALLWPKMAWLYLAVESMSRQSQATLPIPLEILLRQPLCWNVVFLNVMLTCVNIRLDAREECNTQNIHVIWRKRIIEFMNNSVLRLTSIWSCPPHSFSNYTRTWNPPQTHQLHSSIDYTLVEIFLGQVGSWHLRRLLCSFVGFLIVYSHWECKYPPVDSYIQSKSQGIYPVM